MLDFARRNEMYHCGRYVEGKWVFGGICCETKACFLVPVEHMDKDTPIPIIHYLFGSYLQEWLWRKQYGVHPLRNITKHIAEVYDVRETS